MSSGGLHGLQLRWRASFDVRGGFDSLALPPNTTSSLTGSKQTASGHLVWPGAISRFATASLPNGTRTRDLLLGQRRYSAVAYNRNGTLPPIHEILYHPGHYAF